MTASPATVASGGASVLAWTSTNATACMAAGGTFAGAQPTSGTQNTGALSAVTIYTLTCTGPGGTSAPVTATVSIAAPTATLTANPPAVVGGGSSTLTWSSTNATSCTASGGWSGTKATSGSASTGALSATATYSLTCSGVGGASTPASATVTVSTGTVSVSPKTAALAIAQRQQFTATVQGGGGANWTVDGIAGGNASVGIVDATGMYTAGTSTGTHTLLAASGTNTGAAVAAVTDLSGVYTFHNDLARDGANTHEFALTPSNVKAASFGKRAACTVDGAIYAQPLWAANLTLSGAKHNVVFVATQHDSLYAFDADASPCGAPLWKVSLIDSAHGGTAGEIPVPNSAVGGGSGDIAPEIGVTSTPVIDPATGILYILAKSADAGVVLTSPPSAFHHRLHAIDITTGAEKGGSPVTIGATYPGSGDGGTQVAFNAQQEGQRPGLALANGIVYVAWASHGDSTPFYGWLMGYTYNGTSFAQKSVFNTAPNTPFASGATGGAGIWMCGGAPALDPAGNLYVLTGNGPFDADSATAPNNDFGDSMLRFDAAALQAGGQLHVASTNYFTVPTQVMDYANDQDFGSGGASILADLPAGSPVPHLILGGGKGTHFFVLNRDALGGYGKTQGVQPPVYAFGQIYGSGAFWNNTFYIAGTTAPLSAFSLTPSAAEPLSSLPVASTSNSFPEGGGTPSISAAGNTNGIVWVLDNANYCTQNAPNCGAAVLYAYDATNLANSLWNSGALAADAAGHAVKFTVPTIANGRVYVGTRGTNSTGSQNSTAVPGELDIYGLLP